MLNFAVFLHLKNALLAVSSLTPLLKRSSGEYALGAERLLARLQELADGQRLDISSDIAIETQKLISFDGKSAQGRSPRKQRDAFAVGCLERVGQKISQYLQRYEKVFSDCADVCRQIAANLLLVNDFKERALTADDVIHASRTTDAFKPYYAQLLGAVGLYNVRALFDSVLSESGFQ